MRIRAYVFSLFVAALVLLQPANAQVATGTPPFGSFGGGPFDTVNLANLNTHFAIPVVSKAGRGMPFNYTIVYDSSVWYPVGTSGSQVWTPVANFGWAGQTQISTGYVTYFASQTECFDGQQKWSAPTALNFVYHDSFGAIHSFVTGVLGGCNGTEATVAATDGSGYTIQAGVGLGNIFTRAGQTIIPPLNSSSGSATATDRNGNQITVSGSTFTDTLGTTALTVAGQGSNTSPLQFQYTAPNNSTAAVVLNYMQYNIKTNFQCSGISEYAQNAVSLVNSVSLPNGTSYSINYEATPGNTGYTTGRIHSITLPTGGTITYSYSGSNNGIVCADGSAATLTRQTPDGTWTYAHSESGTAWTTNITDPQGNATVMDFQGIYVTEKQVYQGSTSGTLLKTVLTCYNGNATNCNTTAIGQPITQKTAIVQWPGTGGKQSKTNTLYNILGLVTENDAYDYGTGAPGSLLRQTLTTYATLGNNISNRPASITVKDGSGNIKAQTTYSYDQTGVTATSGTPQHVAVSGARGNATTITYLVQGAASLTKTFTYYDTGTLSAAMDVNGSTTTYAYGSGTSCGNSFVTSVSEPLSLSRSMTWKCAGGVQLSITDENSKTTTAAYSDPDFWRPASLTDAASDVTSFTYTGATQVESATPISGSSSSQDLLTTLDGSGRLALSQVREAPGSSTFDSVETDYDSDGRPDRTTLPFAGPAGTVNFSAPGKATTYDALGRKIQTTDSGSRTVGFTYSQNDTNRTEGPHPAGENTKQRQFEYDSLGRITSVCEVTTLLAGSGACGQTTTATGYWTKYSYDALGDLTSVTQNAQSASTQTRTYVYDGLGRMTSEANPESGTTTYVFDSDSTCGTSKGDLVKKVDAVGNTSCYAYDALHRVTSVTYSGLYQSSTPNRYFVYDSATVNSVAMVNAKSRMAEAYTATCVTCTKITDLGISYTALGQPSDVYQSTAHSSGYYHVTASYWPNGLMHQMSNLVGLPTITYGVDGEGRVYSVSASSGQNPVLSTNYNPASEATQVNLGSSDGDTFTYDPNTDRMTQYKFSVNGQSVVGQLTWNPIGTLEDLVVTDPFYSGGNQSCAYTHDDLSRIASANCGAPWSQTFTYDAFGNISKSGTSSFQPTYSYVTNHMTMIGSSVPTYDLNGNVTNDFLHTYAWDANGRPVTADGVGLTYDALGRMVEQNRSGVYTEIVYSPAGGKLALMTGQSLKKAFVPLSGGSVAVYSSSGLAYYRHPDWIGSSRFASTPTRTMYFDGAYAPFGEPYAESGTAELSFTGMNQDTAPNLYDFPAREYGIQGRWPSPDPAGILAVRFRDPQSLNRYAYVRNSPLNRIDPTGMCDTDTPGDDGTDDARRARQARHANCESGDPPPEDPPSQPTPDPPADPPTAPAPDPTADPPSDPNAGDPGPTDPDPTAPDPTDPDPAQPDPGQPDPNQQNQQQQKPGICTQLVDAGLGAVAAGGAAFLAGTATDSTIILAPLGVTLQTFGTIGGIVGGIVSGVAQIAKDVGLCH